MSWGNLTEEKVALYLRDILEALQYLHGWKVAHLDLKVSGRSLLYLHISQVSFFFFLHTHKLVISIFKETLKIVQI